MKLIVSLAVASVIAASSYAVVKNLATDHTHTEAELEAAPIERFTPHDFRRTSRSNTKRLRVDFETAEAMLNHVKKGMERTYDTYELEEEKRLWFLTWENEIARIARRAGVEKALGVPDEPGQSAGSAATGKIMAR